MITNTLIFLRAPYHRMRCRRYPLRFDGMMFRIWPFPVRVWLAAVSVAVMTISSVGGQACSFHLYPPAKTAIDHLIESDHVVLARNSTANPFRYRAIETLSGNADEIAIPHLVDSITRHRFQRDTKGGVVFAFDDDQNAWVALGYTDPAFRQLVDRVLAQRGNWGKNYHPERFAIAESLQDHPDRRLRELALQELDRAPYALLQELDLRLASHALLADLWAFQNAPYVPVRVLLLGLSGESAARTEIHKTIRASAIGGNSSYLGAYATALVEIDGAGGVRMLEQLYLADGAGQSAGKLEAVIGALALHSGTGSASLKQQIQAALLVFLERRPDALTMIASKFASRLGTSQASPPFSAPPAFQHRPDDACCRAYR